MGQCPFCKGQVSAELLRDGGPCPHCLNDIPGEDAATDPGVALRAKEAAAKAAAQRKRKITSIALAAVVLLSIAGGIGYTEYQRSLQYAVLELSFENEFFVVSPEELAQAEAEVKRQEEEERVAISAANTGKKPRNSGKAAGSGEYRPPEEDALAAMEDDRLSTNNDGGSKASAPVAQTTMAPLTVGSGPTIATGPSTAVKRDLPTLTSQAEIDKMVKTAMKRNMGQIKYCYESALRATPNLSGRWTFNFTINTDGTTANISVKGDTMRDAAFEACLAGRVRNWAFQPINKPQPVTFSLPFDSAG
jgi:outer membrane biosynthesis protein TonB